jgi:hypothetical protein
MCMSSPDLPRDRQEEVYAETSAYAKTAKYSADVWQYRAHHMAGILAEAYAAMTTADLKALSADIGTRPTDRYVPTWQPVADLVDAELARRIADVADVITQAPSVAAVAA